MFVLNIVIYGQIWNKCVSNHDHNPTVVQLVHQGPTTLKSCGLITLKPNVNQFWLNKLTDVNKSPTGLVVTSKSYYFLDATNHEFVRWILLLR